MTEAISLPASPPGVLRGSLALRAWGLRVLGAGPASVAEAEWAAVRSCSAEAWRIFFQTDRCALALSVRLGEPDRVRLGDEGMRLLGAGASREARNPLSARAQLAQLGRLGRQLGVPIVVLKSAASLLTGGDAVHMTDVDILVPAARVGEVDEGLSGLGYRREGEDMREHLGTHRLAGGMPVQLHFRVGALETVERIWERLLPLDAAPGLFQLGVADHLWHLLWHGAVSHPERRGTLRDLLVMADAVRAASPEVVHDAMEQALRRAAAEPAAWALPATLTMAVELAAGRTPADLFAEVAAVRAALHRWRAAERVPLSLWVRFHRSAYALHARRGEYRDLWADTRVELEHPSSIRPVAWLQRVFPPLGGAALWACRAAVLGAMAAPAWLVAQGGGALGRHVATD